LCIFDQHGIKLTRTFLKGGKDLNEAISQTLAVSGRDALELKHRNTDLLSPQDDEETGRVSALADAPYSELFEDILRTFLVAKTSGVGEVVTVTFIGGACNTNNFFSYFQQKFEKAHVMAVSSTSFLPPAVPSPQTALALAYALSGLQVHAKDSRF